MKFEIFGLQLFGLEVGCSALLEKRMDREEEMNWNCITRS